MEAPQRVQQLRTQMDPLVSLPANFFSAFSEPQQQGSTFLLLPLPVAAARARCPCSAGSCCSPRRPSSPSSSCSSSSCCAEPGSPEGATCVGRALSHVLSVASRLPVASRKYELVRGLAERLLDDNVRAGGVRVGAVNRAALAGAGMELAVRRGADGDAVVEADGGVLAGRRVWRPRGREAGRRVAVARAEDGRVRRGARGRGAVRRRGETREPRARCRAHAPGLAASASRVLVQARQLEGVRAKRGREGGQGRRRRGPDGDAAVLAAAAVPRQQRHGRPGADLQGAAGDGGRAGGANRQAQLGAAGGDPGALAAPLRRVPRHRLAQSRDLLHALVRRVAQAARVAR